jgi:hypothetical protein
MSPPFAGHRISSNELVPEPVPEPVLEDGRAELPAELASELLSDRLAEAAELQWVRSVESVESVP